MGSSGASPAVEYETPVETQESCLPSTALSVVAGPSDGLIPNGKGAAFPISLRTCNTIFPSVKRDDTKLGQACCLSKHIPAFPPAPNPREQHTREREERNRSHTRRLKNG